MWESENDDKPRKGNMKKLQNSTENNGVINRNSKRNYFGGIFDREEEVTNRSVVLDLSHVVDTTLFERIEIQGIGGRSVIMERTQARTSFQLESGRRRLFYFVFNLKNKN